MMLDAEPKRSLDTLGQENVGTQVLTYTQFKPDPLTRGRLLFGASVCTGSPLHRDF